MQGRAHGARPQGCFSLSAESRLYTRAPLLPDARLEHPRSLGVAHMRFHADLHVHSKYSRATSRDLDLEHLAAWACRKGLAVVATGDFTHPPWPPSSRRNWCRPSRA